MAVFRSGSTDGNIFADLGIGFVYNTRIDITRFNPRKHFADILCKDELGSNLIGKAEILKNLFGILPDRYGFRFADSYFLYGISGKGFERSDGRGVFWGNQNNLVFEDILYA